MNSSIGGHLPGPSPQHSIAPHPNAGRPGIDRAHTFPTPPTSASSVMGSMGNSDGNFASQWGAQGGMGGQGANPLSIDTGLSNARSMPTTPATTPPGTSLQSMQQYQQSSQPYDTSRQMYSAPPPQQNTYPPLAATDPNMRQYPQTNSYIKNEMGPPLARAPGTETDHHDPKDSNGMIHHNQGQTQVNHGHEDEGDHEHDAEYTHGNSSGYDSNRAPYNYANAPPVGSLNGEHAHLSPEMTGSPNHPASGRATPRTASAPQPYYAQQQGGYNTPPRVQQPPSSNLYNVMSSERGTANGTANGDVYAAQSDLGGPLPNGYATQQPVMNGIPQSNKRGRDDEDDSRPSSRGPVDGGLKRRKTLTAREGSVSGPSYDPSLNRARTAITQRR